MPSQRFDEEMVRVWHQVRGALERNPVSWYCRERTAALSKPSPRDVAGARPSSSPPSGQEIVSQKVDHPSIPLFSRRPAQALNLATKLPNLSPLHTLADESWCSPSKPPSLHDKPPSLRSSPRASTSRMSESIKSFRVSTQVRRGRCRDGVFDPQRKHAKLVCCATPVFADHTASEAIEWRAPFAPIHTR